MCNKAPVSPVVKRFQSNFKMTQLIYKESFKDLIEGGFFKAFLVKYAIKLNAVKESMITGITYWVFISPLNSGRELCNKVMGAWGGTGRNNG